MENKQIRILERFDVISITMPYYGSTHKSFLLLSALSPASRSKLDEFYQEFINIIDFNLIN